MESSTFSVYKEYGDTLGYYEGIHPYPKADFLVYDKMNCDFDVRSL